MTGWLQRAHAWLFEGDIFASVASDDDLIRIHSSAEEYDAAAEECFMGIFQVRSPQPLLLSVTPCAARLSERGNGFKDHIVMLAMYSCLSACSYGHVRSSACLFVHVLNRLPVTSVYLHSPCKIGPPSSCMPMCVCLFALLPTLQPFCVKRAGHHMHDHHNSLCCKQHPYICGHVHFDVPHPEEQRRDCNSSYRAGPARHWRCWHVSGHPALWLQACSCYWCVSPLFGLFSVYCIFAALLCSAASGLFCL